MYQPERLRQREQPQRLGGGRAVDDDEVPVVGERVQPQLEQREHLLGARDDGQLLGGDRVHAGGVEHREQVALDLRPRLLEPQLGVDLLHEQVVGDLGRLGADRVPNASASECAASVDSTRVRWPAAAARAAVPEATVDLPTPPLPVNRRMPH